MPSYGTVCFKIAVANASGIENVLDYMFNCYYKD